MNSPIADRYELLEPVGSGGMGRVMRARDTVLDREVAIKLLPEEVADDPKRRERFEREARAGARLSHPNILAVHDFGMDDGQPYAVMELLEGSDLRTRLVEGPLPWRDATDVALQAARGLAAAHREGVIHRDLKPANLFLCADGTVKILDFGLARLEEPRHTAEDDGLEDSTLTATGVVMGTAAYMAPEQVRGQPADGRSDLFALGCVLHEALSGTRPFRGDSSAEIMSAILRDEPAPIAEPIPKALREVLHRCLRKDPDRRFGSAAEVVAALEAIRSSGDVELSLEPVVEETPQRTAGISRRTVAWAAAVGLAGIVIASALIAWQQSTQVAGPPPDLDPNRIAVVPFANRTGDPSLEDLGALAADRISQGLAELEEIEVVPTGAVRTAIGDSDSNGGVRRVAEGTRAGLVVTGAWDRFDDGLALQATLQDVARGSAVRAFAPIHGSRDTPEETIGTLRDRVLMAVQDHLHPMLAWGAGETLPRYESYQAYRDIVETVDAIGVFEAVARASEVVELDPSFVRARMQIGSMVSRDVMAPLRRPMMELYEPAHDADLTPRQLRLVAMIDHRMAGRYQESFRIARDELARDPTDSWQRFQLLKSAHFANRPAAAIDAYQGLEWDPIAPGLFRFGAVEWAAAAYHRLGRHGEELELARAATARGPQHTTGSSTLRAELRALSALGRVDEIDRKLGERLTEASFFQPYVELHMVAGELRVHGHGEAARQIGTRALEVFRWPDDDGETGTCLHCDTEARAHVLVDGGRREQAYSEVLAAVASGIPAQPGDSWDRTVAYFAAIAGDAPAARTALDRWLAGEPESADGSVAYETAKVLALLGDRDEAIRRLRNAVLDGFFAWDELHCEIAFEDLRDDPEFQDIVRPKG